jgi:hypothetical protein
VGAVTGAPDTVGAGGLRVDAGAAGSGWTAGEKMVETPLLDVQGVRRGLEETAKGGLAAAASAAAPPDAGDSDRTVLARKIETTQRAKKAAAAAEEYEEAAVLQARLQPNGLAAGHAD